MQNARLLRLIAVAGLIALAAVASRADAHAEPDAAEIVRLWPTDPPVPAGTKITDAEPGETMKAGGTKGDPNFMVSGVTRPWLAAYLPAADAPPRTAVILCPGGGYAYEAITKVGTDVARRLNQSGVAAFVLKYRLPDSEPVGPDELPGALQDVLRAVQVVRANAKEWNVDPARVGVMGFSAGGHVAAMSATMYGEAGKLPADDAVSKRSARPDFVALVFAVISMRDGLAHGGSRNRLLGKHPTPESAGRFSTDEHVTADTPTLFVIHAKDDPAVPVANAERMAAAAEKAGVPHKLILLDIGGHGFGLGRPGTDSVGWIDRFFAWGTAQHLLTPVPK